MVVSGNADDVDGGVGVLGIQFQVGAIEFDRAAAGEDDVKERVVALVEGVHLVDGLAQIGFMIDVAVGEVVHRDSHHRRDPPLLQGLHGRAETSWFLLLP